MLLGELVKGNDSAIVKEINIKMHVINYLFETIKLPSYGRIDIPVDYSKLLNGGHFILPNYKGVISFLLFLNFNGSNIAVVVNKLTLKYDKNRTLAGINDVDMIYISTSHDNKFFHDTILDGVFTLYGSHGNFMITDVHVFNGIKMINEYLASKLDNFKLLLSNNISTNDKSNNNSQYSRLEVSPVFNFSQIHHLLDEVYPTMRNKLKGFDFVPYPTMSKTTPLHNYDLSKQLPSKLIMILNDKNINNNTPNIHNVKNIQNIHNIHNVNNVNTERKNIKLKFFSHDESKLIEATLEMIRSSGDKGDIYKLYAIDYYDLHGKLMYKKVNMGIAYISTSDKSKQFRELFLDLGNKNSVLMKCKFNHKYAKWEPTAIDTIKKQPTFYNEIDIETMEIINSDDES